MAKNSTMTAAMLKAIHDSGLSLYAIAKETGVDKSALGRFVAGKQSLRLDRADKLAAYLGLELVKKRGSKTAKKR
jgi:DNA transposition AAA+ family ATPase